MTEFSGVPAYNPKYKVGFLLAHQNLNQLGTQLRATVQSSTSIKFVGGVNEKDRRMMAAEMATTPEFIENCKKYDKDHYSEFACWIKNFTHGAIRAKVPFGVLEQMEKKSKEEYAAMIDANRARYCESVSERQKKTQFFSEPEEVPNDSEPPSSAESPKKPPPDPDEPFTLGDRELL
ncbi:MAG: hypothetical protein GY783_06210 [Gammaproteobacteria bacterium]|nr:hypothetical protein [Gammaproteobacteria bacterium]